MEFTFLMMTLLSYVFAGYFFFEGPSPLPPLLTNYYLSLVLWLLGDVVHSVVNYSKIHLERQAMQFVTYPVPEKHAA